MICPSVLNRVPETIEDTLRQRRDLVLYQLNEALFSKAMTYQETWEIRVWMKTVNHMLERQCFEEAANVLTDAEYIVDRAMESSFDEELVNT